MSDEIPDVEISIEDYVMIKIIGNDTYHIREELKKLGCFWNHKSKYWFLLVSTYADPDREQVDAVLDKIDKLLEEKF